MTETAVLVHADPDVLAQAAAARLLVRIVDRPWYSNLFNKLFHGGPQWQNSI